MSNKYGILEYKLEDWHPNKYGYKSININDVGVELFDCLSYDELMMFFTEYINSYDGSLDHNKNFYKPKELIKRTNNKLIPLNNR